MANEIKTIFVSSRREIARPTLEIPPTTAVPRRKRHRKKRMRISEALRHEGIDERELAKTLAGIIERQSPKTDSEDANDKLLAGVVMNCLRYLEDDTSEPGAMALGVHLVHHVPRPQRTIEIENNEKGSGT
jgi:hypothetical protein